MAKNQVSHIRSTEVWIDLINRCRQSGKTDHAWCTENGIAVSSFYAAIRRLRKKEVLVPEKAAVPMIDLTTENQDVVRIGIIDDEVIEEERPMPSVASSSPGIEVSVFGAHIIVNSGTDRRLLSAVLHVLKEISC